MQRRFTRRKKVDPFEKDKTKKIDYKDVDMLRNYISERGKILPRRITGVSSRFQALLAQAVKRARHVGLLPFVGED